MKNKRSKKLRAVYSVLKDYYNDRNGIHYIRYFEDYVLTIDDFGNGYIIVLTDENEKYIYIGNDTQSHIYIGEKIPFSTIQEAKKEIKYLGEHKDSFIKEIKERFRKKVEKK